LKAQYEVQIIKEAMEKKPSINPDEFGKLLYQLQYHSYHKLLLHNLEDLKPIIKQEQYLILRSIYSDLLLFWAKLYCMLSIWGLSKNLYSKGCFIPQ